MTSSYQLKSILNKNADTLVTMATMMLHEL